MKEFINNMIKVFEEFIGVLKNWYIEDDSDIVKNEVGDEDILINPKEMIYGEYDEVVDAMPNALEGVVNISEGTIFCKGDTFDSIKEFIDNVEYLAKKIRPSRDNISAPEFREAVETWVYNMKSDALERQGINLGI